MLFELKRYVCNNEVVVPHFHWRQQAGLRVSTAPVESAVNSVVNLRMNKRRQMRWSEDGGRLLLRVRAAVINGDLNQLHSERAPTTRAEPAALVLAA